MLIDLTRNEMLVLTVALQAHAQATVMLDRNGYCLMTGRTISQNDFEQLKLQALGACQSSMGKIQKAVGQMAAAPGN